MAVAPFRSSTPRAELVRRVDHDAAVEWPRLPEGVVDLCPRDGEHDGVGHGDGFRRDAALAPGRLFASCASFPGVRDPLKTTSWPA
jgi:hypothetical protein